MIQVNETNFDFYTEVNKSSFAFVTILSAEMMTVARWSSEAEATIETDRRTRNNHTRSPILQRNIIVIGN